MGNCICILVVVVEVRCMNPVCTSTLDRIGSFRSENSRIGLSQCETREVCYTDVQYPNEQSACNAELLEDNLAENTALNETMFIHKTV